MSFISPVSTRTTGSSSGSGATGTDQLGKDDFLQLMVTKLQYQDPLNPMEDEDFIAQLAQFSSLEQMSNIADGIATSNEWDFLQMQSLNNVLASNLIGREVEADFSGVYLDESNQPKITYTLPQTAQEIKFEIRNSSGELVANMSAEDLVAGAHTITWDGKDSLGNRADAGYYTIKATAANAAGTSVTPKLGVIGVVSTVTYRDGSAYVMIDGTEIALGDIRSVGTPSED
jgi:flagellar basal-body rod modification protein FlgD